LAETVRQEDAMRVTKGRMLFWAMGMFALTGCMAPAAEPQAAGQQQPAAGQQPATGQQAVSPQPGPPADAFAAVAKKFPTKKDDAGHVSPVIATVTPLTGPSRPVMVLGVGEEAEATLYYTHAIKGRSEDGSSEVTFFFDAIRELKEMTDVGYLAVMKDGTTRKVLWTGDDCAGEPMEKYGRPHQCSFLSVVNPDASQEVIDLSKVRSLAFR
jgi:hypothetical protein